jgi:hypothetical protein
LRWTDFDAVAGTLQIERAVEETRAGLTIKGPKKEAHRRTIAIAKDLVALLVAERDRPLRIVAGIPEGAHVDLSLVKLPVEALIFPSLSAGDLVSLQIHGTYPRSSSGWQSALAFPTCACTIFAVAMRQPCSMPVCLFTWSLSVADIVLRNCSRAMLSAPRRPISPRLTR